MEQRKKLRPLLSVCATCLAGWFVSTTELRSAPTEFPGGFELGASLEATQLHAKALGWELSEVSPHLPGQWVVEGLKDPQISFFVCDDTVTGISQIEAGDLDKFARLLDAHRRRRRQMDPDIQIVTFRAGITRVSNIDVRFPEANGNNATMQLSSIDGQLQISTNCFIEGPCADE